MPSRRPRVFFAIPCGEFYSVQRDIISGIADKAHVEPIIAEDDPQTKGLWEKICGQIQGADFFMADISSASPNILLELGYAIKERGTRNVGIFVSANASVPSDLHGIVRQQYSSFTDFHKHLLIWLSDLVPMLDPDGLGPPPSEPAGFQEDFKDQDRFLHRWSIPPGGSYLLTHEGLKFTNAHFPILTTTLAMLGNCEFEFRARIDSGKIGWVVRGSQPPNWLVPVFCVMFNLDSQGILSPHILNIAQSEKYQSPWPTKSIAPCISADGWFTLVTKVMGDSIEIEQDGRQLFQADFGEEPYKAAYTVDFPKEGQVGFRCHPGERATVNYVRVRELQVLR